MAFFKGKYFNIVLLGRQNPQILNHDFLIKNNIIPFEIEPFKSAISNKEIPFTNFLSSPILTTINYNSISILVEENRFQISDNDWHNPILSPITGISNKYFGDILPHTPINVCGMNLNGDAQFENDGEKWHFYSKVGINKNEYVKFSKTEDLDYGILSVEFPLEEGRLQIRVQRQNKNLCNLNLNFESLVKKVENGFIKTKDVELLYKKLKEFLAFVDLRGE